MRTLNVEEISKNIKEMCIEANHFLSKDMDIAMKNAVSTEKSPLGKKILSQLQDNLKIAVENVNLDTVVGYKAKGVRHNFLDTYDD